MSLASNSETENITLLREAMDLGINFLDTADLYDKGMSEIAVGKAIKKMRKKIILATKAGNQWRSDGTGWDWNPRKDYILQAVEKSLGRLQTDYIDLYQLHGGTIEDPIDETIEAFEQLKKEGKIRHYGISSIRPNVIREYVKRSSIASVMIQYSVADRRPQESILELLQQNNISVLARGALAQGLLVDKPAKEYLGYSKEEIEKARVAVQSLSGPDRNAAQTAIQYVLHHPVVASAVVGIRNKKQLKEIAVAGKKLAGNEVKMLEEVIQAKRYEQHR